MNKKLIPAVAAAAVLCAMLAVMKIQNPAPNTGSGEKTVNASEQDAGTQGQAEKEEQAGQVGQAGQAGQAGQEEQAEQAEEAAEAEENAGTGVQPEQYKPLSITETEDYTEKVLQVVGTESAERTTNVRFYKENPHVPYMGIREYFDLLLGGGLKMQTEGDGTITLTNAAGAQAVVDIAEGTVTSQDMPSFENYYDEAKEELIAALRSNPDDEKAVLLLGKTYLAMDDAANARAMYREYLDNPNCAAASYNGLAMCDLKERNYRSALQNIKDGLACNDDTIMESLLYNEIIVYEHMQDWTTARVKAAAFAATFPTNEAGQRENEFLSTR